jgi:hypothetical protein
MLVGVDPEDPLAKAVLEACIARAPEIVVPITFDDLGSSSLRDFDGRISRTGVVNDNFVDNALERLEATRQRFFLVLHDHAGGEKHFAPGGLGQRLDNSRLCRRRGCVTLRRPPLGPLTPGLFRAHGLPFAHGLLFADRMLQVGSFGTHCITPVFDLPP